MQPSQEPNLIFFLLLEGRSTIWAISARLPSSHIPALYSLAIHPILHTADLKDEREIPQTMENSTELMKTSIE